MASTENKVATQNVDSCNLNIDLPSKVPQLIFPCNWRVLNLLFIEFTEQRLQEEINQLQMQLDTFKERDANADYQVIVQINKVNLDHKISKCKSKYLIPEL